MSFCQDMIRIHVSDSFAVVLPRFGISYGSMFLYVLNGSVCLLFSFLVRLLVFCLRFCILVCFLVCCSFSVFTCDSALCIFLYVLVFHFRTKRCSKFARSVLVILLGMTRILFPIPFLFLRFSSTSISSRLPHFLVLRLCVLYVC